MASVSKTKGYVVRWKDDAAPTHASGFLFAVDVDGTVTTRRERAAVLPTVGAALEAASAMRVRDVSIFRVHADGREEKLPSYEDALAEIERLSRSEAACVREALEQVGVARAERDEARADAARIPGLEQANREAHQAIAGLKAKTARVNKAWARLVKAAQADMATLGIVADDGAEENIEVHAQANAAYWAAVQALRALGVDVDALLRGANR